MKGIQREILSYISSASFVQLLGLISLVLLMKKMDVETFGLYSYICDFVGIFLFIADGGIAIYLVREISQNKKNQWKIYKTAQLYQYIFSFTLFFIIMLVALILVDKKYYLYVFIYAIGMILMSIYNPINGLWIGLNDKNNIVFRDIFLSFAKFGFLILGVWLSLGLGYFLSSSLVIGLLWAAIILKMNKVNKLEYLGINSELKDLKAHFIGGIPFVIILLSNVLYNKIDIIIIEKINGLEAVSFYSAASKFVYPFGFISTAFMNSIFPRMAESIGKKNKSRSILLFSFVTLGVLGLAIALSLRISGGYVFEFLFNDKYDNSIPVFNILVFMIPILFMLSAVNNFLFTYKKTNFIITINFLLIFLNTILNFMYLPLYGIEAAAYITVACEALVLFLSSIIAYICIKKSNV